MNKPTTCVDQARRQRLKTERFGNRKRPPKPKRCTNGHDMHLAYAAIYCRGQGAVGHWLCRVCRDERTRNRKPITKGPIGQRVSMSEAEFTTQYLALNLQLERAATHWERDVIRQQMADLQRQHGAGGA